MSYRSFKHLLGETSLERKCRFIFGLGILVLVTASFFWYGQKTESLVTRQRTEKAQMLVNYALLPVHVKALGNSDFESITNVLFGDFKPSTDDLPDHMSRVVSPYQSSDPKKQPADEFERAAVDRFIKAAAAADTTPRTASGRESSHTFADGTPKWVQRLTNGRRDFQHVQAVFFAGRCLTVCHGQDGTNLDNHLSRLSPDGKDWVQPKEGDLAGAVVVTIPMDKTTKAINQNRAFLIAAALITAILAMLSSYIFVRYVIVKPVKHLRDVSDAIAAGRLNIRASIQTGDEFEELSYAFNRMLHNLVAMQQELRDVNNDLDRKVDELAQANLALFEMNRLKSDFLATMSHELRTPLNSIIGFSEVLSASEVLNDRHRRYAGNIQSSGKMLLSMINDILDLAKIESGKMEVRSEDFSIRDVCEGLANLCRPVAERKNITARVPAGRGDSALAAGSGQAPADHLQLAFQRDQVHTGGRARDLASPGRRPVRRDRGSRHRDRHRRGRPGDHLREIPPGQASRPGRDRPDSRVPRHRPRAFDRPRADQAPGRRRPPGKPDRPGQHVHRADSPHAPRQSQVRGHALGRADRPHQGAPHRAAFTTAPPVAGSSAAGAAPG